MPRELLKEFGYREKKSFESHTNTCIHVCGGFTN